jgi:hypothetical protein
MTDTDVGQLLKDFDKQDTAAQLLVVLALYERQTDLAFELARHAMQLWELRRLLQPKGK